MKLKSFSLPNSLIVTLSESFVPWGVSASGMLGISNIRELSLDSISRTCWSNRDIFSPTLRISLTKIERSLSFSMRPIFLDTVLRLALRLSVA